MAGEGGGIRDVGGVAAGPISGEDPESALARLIRIRDRLRELWSSDRASLPRDEIAALIEAMADSEREIRELRHRMVVSERRDSLTGVLSRPAILAETEAAIAGCAGEGRGAALLADINRFSAINERFGSSAGDGVLRQVARRLERLVEARSDETAEGEEARLGRIGTDRFLVLLPRIASDREATDVALGILHILEEPVVVGTEAVAVTASIGIVHLPEDAGTADAALARAAAALADANRYGRGRIARYRPEIGPPAPAMRALEPDLRSAARFEQLHLVFQPKVRCADGAIVGAEGLLRWRHPEHGLIGPDQFIPLAEETLIIEQIGGFVLGAACKAARAIKNAGFDMTVAINVSARQFGQPAFIERFWRAMKQYDLEPERFEIEISELSMHPSRDDMAGALEALRAIGFRLILDDFGRGQTSLAFLAGLPFDGMTIDRSFVAGIGHSSTAERMIGGALKLADELGLETIAEGVETEAQFAFVRERRCAFAQGFLLSPPVELDDFLALVRHSPFLGPASPS